MVEVLKCEEKSVMTSGFIKTFWNKARMDIKLKYTGKWYAAAKKDPEGVFLHDNIEVEYTVTENSTLISSSKGRLRLFGFWMLCADMTAEFIVPDPSIPAKMVMTYQGIASYLFSGGDNYWVIDTDYNNYAITYTCRTLHKDGTCKDGYSFVFSRYLHNFSPTIQRTIRKKQEQICLAGQFKPVLQSALSEKDKLQGLSQLLDYASKESVVVNVWTLLIERMEERT
ncbi:purpurin-like [Protopterus annectens]|uniref:purpurin-like n=1 Tax=Protopterus annectens TaxID=7888 RepID=UPI001CFA3836|nr:purpurin-like [Protopterus annectens]